MAIDILGVARRVRDRLLDIVRGVLSREPARFVGWGSGLVVTAVLKLGSVVGVSIPDDVTIAVGLVATFGLTEVIRQVVYAPATVDNIVTDAVLDAAKDATAKPAPTPPADTDPLPDQTTPSDSSVDAQG